MARSLRLDRLMRASHAHVEATARDESQENQILAMRLIEHPGTYADWENRHSQLMQRVCQPTRLRAQMVRMRETTLGLVHRRAVFEYLRDRKITGAKRHQYIAFFYGARDYATSVIVEHGHYMRSWVSASCSRYIGSEILRDPAFDLQLATAETMSTACEKDLLPFLKERATLARERLVRLK
jgi:hypothetical protein